MTDVLLTHLFTFYQNINSGDLTQNKIKMSMTYNVDIHIKALFDQIKHEMDYAAAGKNPKILGQIVMTGQQLITETDTKKIKDWKHLPVIDMTLARFKVDLTLAYQNFQKNALLGTIDSQENNMALDAELTKAMENLVIATAADMTEVRDLTAKVSCIATELTKSNV